MVSSHKYDVFPLECQFSVPVSVGSQSLEVILPSSFHKENTRALFAMSKTPCNRSSRSTTWATVSNEMPTRISRSMDSPPTTMKSYPEEIEPIFTSNPGGNKEQ